MNSLALASGTSITAANRELWLAERKHGLGASDTPAVLGVSPYSTPLRVYLEKLEIIGPPEETDAMRFGRRMESLLIEEYAERTGRQPLGVQVYYRAPGDRPLFATVDAVLGDRLLEAKTVGVGSRVQLGEEGTDEVPYHWIVQAHQQMYCAGAYVVDFIVYHSHRARMYQVQMNADLMTVLLDNAVSFWDDHVLARRPPEATVPDADLMAALEPNPSGTRELTPQEQALAIEYASTIRSIGELNNTKAKLRFELEKSLGSCSAGWVSDGSWAVRRKVISVAGSTYTRKPYTYSTIEVRNTGESNVHDADQD